MANTKDQMIARIIEMAKRAGQDPAEALALHENKGNTRYSMNDRWVEFECGCRMIRVRNLQGTRPSDPIIFRGLPEQAVYDLPCGLHMAGVNKYIGLGGQYKDFQSWKRDRFYKIAGR